MDRCGAASWMLLAIFVILCLLLTWYNVRSVRREYALKRKANALCPSDIDLTDGGTLAFVLIMAVVGSMAGNALGLGGGFIYNPV